MSNESPTSAHKTARFRSLLDSGRIVLAPGCFNPVSAILIEQAAESFELLFERPAPRDKDGELLLRLRP